MGKNKQYNNYYNNNHNKNQETSEIMTPPVMDEEVVTEDAAGAVTENAETEESTTLSKGMVVECTQLRVRKEPNDKADVLCLLDVSTYVEIDLEASTTDFYKVITESGVEGYCMKKFIVVV